MKKMLFAVTATCIFGIGFMALASEERDVSPAPNGIAFPADYRDWRVISIAHRTDNQTMRAILGNDIAIEAARRGETLPWPDGTVLGKVVWKEGSKEAWPAAIAPQQFVHVEFMLKDSSLWPEAGGWG